MKTSPRTAAAMSVVAALVLALSACAGDAAQPTAAPATAAATTSTPVQREASATVEVENIAFQPPEMTVLAGTKVTWINRDKDVAHTATSGQGGDKGIPGIEEPTASQPDGTFDGNLPNAGDTYSHVFEEAGTYPYFCAIHPSMRGTIVVE